MSKRATEIGIHRLKDSIAQATIEPTPRACWAHNLTVLHVMEGRSEHRIFSFDVNEGGTADPDSFRPFL